MSNLKEDKKILAKNKSIEGVRDVEYWLFFMKENIFNLRQKEKQRGKMVFYVLSPFYLATIFIMGLIYGAEAAFVIVIVGVFVMITLGFLLKLILNLSLGRINTDFNSRGFKYLFHFLVGLRHETFNHRVKLTLNTEKIENKKYQLPETEYTLPENLPDNVKIMVYETGRAEALFRYWDGSKGRFTIIERMVKKEKRSIGQVSGKRKLKSKRKYKFYILLELLLSKENYTIKPTSIQDQDGLYLKVKELKDKNIVLLKHKLKYDPSGVMRAEFEKRLQETKPNPGEKIEAIEDNLDIINVSLNTLFEQKIIVRNELTV